MQELDGCVGVGWQGWCSAVHCCFDTWCRARLCSCWNRGEDRGREVKGTRTMIGVAVPCPPPWYAGGEAGLNGEGLLPFRERESAVTPGLDSNALRAPGRSKGGTIGNQQHSRVELKQHRSTSVGGAPLPHLCCPHLPQPTSTPHRPLTWVRPAFLNSFLKLSKEPKSRAMAYAQQGKQQASHIQHRHTAVAEAGTGKGVGA